MGHLQTFCNIFPVYTIQIISYFGVIYSSQHSHRNLPSTYLIGTPTIIKKSIENNPLINMLIIGEIQF
jgi:hypothetical protein